MQKIWLKKNKVDSFVLLLPKKWKTFFFKSLFDVYGKWEKSWHVRAWRRAGTEKNLNKTTKRNAYDPTAEPLCADTGSGKPP